MKLKNYFNFLLKTGLCVFSISLMLSTFVASANNQARSLELVGSAPVKLKLNDGRTKIVSLLRLKLSQHLRDAYASRINKILHDHSPLKAPSDLPPSKSLGMNGEPVLDQGVWGTCTTFANTGAINALFSLQGDQRVSQLCNLQVGRTQASPDGYWNGAWGDQVLKQINDDGYLPLTYQRATGCGGLKEYPTHSYDNGNAMSADTFKASSLKTFTAEDWKTIFQNYNPLPLDQAKQMLVKVKEALNAGDRVTFATLLTPVGNMGAVGTYKGVANDTWVLTPEVSKDIKDHTYLGGHEIIIDGYDDNACATYTEQGELQQQCGLFEIRNSWGDKAGNQGDWYMTYDHFMGLAMEAFDIGAKT